MTWRFAQLPQIAPNGTITLEPPPAITRQLQIELSDDKQQRLDLLLEVGADGQLAVVLTAPADEGCCTLASATLDLAAAAQEWRKQRRGDHHSTAPHPPALS